MHTRVLIVPGGMQESQRQGGRCEDGAECGGTWGREPRNAGSLLEQERSKNQILPAAFRRHVALRPMVDFGTQNCKNINVPGLSHYICDNASLQPEETNTPSLPEVEAVAKGGYCYHHPEIREIKSSFPNLRDLLPSFF